MYILPTLLNHSSHTQQRLPTSNSTYSSLESICQGLMRNDPDLTILTLNCTELGNEDAHVFMLAQALQYNTRIEALFLNQTRLRGKSAAWRALATTIANHVSLRDLYLSYNLDLGDEGVTVLAQALMKASRSQQEQQQCAMKHCIIEKEDGTLFSNKKRHLANGRSERVLDTGVNGGSPSRRLILDSQNANVHGAAPLRVLKLAFCQVGDDGCRALSQWLSNKTKGTTTSSCRLEILDLQQNDISIKGFRFLARALQTNQSLERINVRDNPLLWSTQQVQPAELQRSPQHQQQLVNGNYGVRATARAESRRRAPHRHHSSATCLWQSLAIALGPTHSNMTLKAVEFFPKQRKENVLGEIVTTENIHGTNDLARAAPFACICHERASLYMTLNRWGRPCFLDCSISPWTWSDLLAKPAAMAAAARSSSWPDTRNLALSTSAITPQTIIQESEDPLAPRSSSAGAAAATGLGPNRIRDVIEESLSPSLLYYLLRCRPDFLANLYMIKKDVFGKNFSA
ncbi:hypothetical protein ACA910_014805 [Epithemia clementina (nom. ined.)]